VVVSSWLSRQQSIHFAPRVRRGCRLRVINAPQGNPRILHWNSVAAPFFADAGALVISTYDVTAGLDAAYDGSEDGMHFGLLVNHEKVQRVLGGICGANKTRQDGKRREPQQEL
jgi:hypothetical protein